MSTPRKSLEPFLFDSINYYDHQVSGVRWMARHRNFLLADEMGTGKSLQALTTFIVDVKRGWAKTLLIVCPMILKQNWKDEIEKFSTIPATVLEGSGDERVWQVGAFMLAEGPRILIAHYEQVAADHKMLDACHFDAMLIDEAHYIKNPDAKRTKAVLSTYSHRTFVLTGTPMLNRITELFPLLHRIDPKAFPDYGSFKSRYVVFGGHNKREIVAIKNEAELLERLNHVMLRRLKKDVLDLPEVNIVTRKVDMYNEQQHVYDLLTDMKLPRPDEAEPEEIEYVIAQFIRQKQVCGSTYLFTGEDVSAKMDAAMIDDSALIESGEKIVIFTQFRPILELYHNRLKSAYPELPVFQLHGGVPEKERVPMTKEWAAVDGASVLLCMIQVAGVGLNLVASRNVSFLDELFTPGLNQQAIDRVHRIGADLTQPITVRKYVTRGTVEERIQQILTKKSALITGVVENNPDWKRELIRAMQEDEIVGG